MKMQKKLIVGQKVFFTNEVPAYEVKAISITDRYAVVVRKLHRRHDAELLHREVEMSAFCTFTEAYNYYKDKPVYSILDLIKMKRGPHNMVFNCYDFSNERSLKKLLIDLQRGKVELSQRNKAALEIDWDKTL